jgi:translation initiation factor 2 subunit 1
MLYQKTNFPEESEIVLCTVAKIQYHSVFVTLDEYNNLQGLIHISEISPGRIRNLGDFVQEGKKIVCKVLKVNEERGHIDLSLRRVSQIQRRDKVDEIKQEQKAEKILEFAARQNGLEVKKLFDSFKDKLFEQFTTLHSAFQAIVDGSFTLNELGIDPKVAPTLEEVIRQRIKPPKVEISGELQIQSYEPDGVEIIKTCLENVLKKHENIDIFYLGGGRFSYKVSSVDFKIAEKVLEESTGEVREFMEKHNSTVEFNREDGKKAKAD